MKAKWIFILVIGLMFAGAQAFAQDDILPEGEKIEIEEAMEVTPALRFYAVKPCRIYDSRRPNSMGNGGVWFPGRSDQIWIDQTEVSMQGGNPAGCPPPRDPGPNQLGEPRAVHIYCVAVPLFGGINQGNILAYPPQFAVPSNGAILNYKWNVQNIGNAVSVETRIGVGEDLGLLNRFGFTHIVCDAFGYYYP